MSQDTPLLPLTSLNSPIVIWGPNDEQLTLHDPRCEEVGIKKCVRCQRVKLLTEFIARWDNKQYKGYCRPCSTELKRIWAVGNPDSVHASVILGKYHLSGERYNEMLAAQGGVCMICGKPPVANTKFAHLTCRP